MYCEACSTLLASPLLDGCPVCGYPVKIEIEKRVEIYLETLLTPSIWQALHSSPRNSLTQAEEAYHTIWLLGQKPYDFEIVRRLYARAVVLQFEADVIAPFVQEIAEDLDDDNLAADLANSRVYWLAKYIRKCLKGEAYSPSIQQMYLLLTYLGGKGIGQNSYLVSKLLEFLLSHGNYNQPSRLWHRTKSGEGKFRSWVSELAFFDHKGPKTYSTPPSPIRTLQQLQRYRHLLCALENDNGLPLLLNVTQGVSLDISSSTEEIRSLDDEQVLGDYKQLLAIKKEGFADTYKRMPYPLVAVRHAIEVSESYHSKFVSALRCAESVAAYCAVIATAERFYMDFKPPFADRQELYLFFTNLHASFGSWINLLTASVEALASATAPVLVPEVAQFARSRNIGLLKRLKHTRDLEDAHAIPYPESIFAEKLGTIIPVINELYEAVAFLNKYPLVVVRKTENLATMNRYDFLALIGAVTDFKVQTKNCPVDLRLSHNNLYVMSPRCDSAVPLAPFLVYEACDTCNCEELFCLDIIDQENNRATYLSLTTNHRKTTDKYMGLFSAEQ